VFLIRMGRGRGGRNGCLFGWVGRTTASGQTVGCGATDSFVKSEENRGTNDDDRPHLRLVFHELIIADEVPMLDRAVRIECSPSGLIVPRGRLVREYPTQS